MHWIDIIRISLRMLRTNFLRSLLTIVGIGVAISFIVLLIGLGYGLQNLTIGSIIQSKSLLSLDVQANEREGAKLSPKTIDQMKALPEAAAVSPVVVTNGQVAIDERLGAVVVTSATQDYLEMEGINIEKGKVFDNSGQEIVVSPETLSLLNIPSESAVGKVVKLTYTDPNNENEIKTLDHLTLVGVTAATGAPALYLPYQLMTKDGEVRITSVKVVARDRDSILAVRDAATHLGYTVDSLIETLDQARIIFKWITIGLGIFGTIALIVASIGMFNTLTK